jgi:hypothetical protein
VPKANGKESGIYISPKIRVANPPNMINGTTGTTKIFAKSPITETLPIYHIIYGTTVSCVAMVLAVISRKRNLSGTLLHQDDA